MTRRLIGASLAALSLAVGGFVLANSQVQTAGKHAQRTEQGYTCPVTGEELPCPKCCPLNQRQ